MRHANVPPDKYQQQSLRTPVMEMQALIISRCGHTINFYQKFNNNKDIESIYHTFNQQGTTILIRDSGFTSGFVDPMAF